MKMESKGRPYIILVLIILQTLCCETEYVYNEMQCEDLCLRMPNCGAYKLGSEIRADMKLECILFPDKFERLKLRDQIAVSCRSKPCKHGGECIQDTTRCRRFRCNCKKNWTGETCETKVKDGGDD